MNAACGTLWSETHSKLSKTFDRRTDVGRLTWGTINNYVDDRAFVDQGFVWTYGSWRRDYFVHPLTGILEKVPTREPIRYPISPPDTIKLDEMHTLNQVEGIWYLDTFHMVDHSWWETKCLLKRNLYGKLVQVLGKRWVSHHHWAY